MTRRQRLAGPIAVLVGACLLYQPLLHAGWIFEDSLSMGPPIQFTSFAHLLQDWWRLGVVVEWSAQQMIGATPLAEHLVNLLVHLVNTGLIGVVAWLADGKRRQTALIAMAIWAVHPMLVPAVAYVTALPELLVATGTLVTAILWLSWAPRWWAVTLAVIAMGLTVCVKSSAVGVAVVPVLLTVAWTPDTDDLFILAWIVGTDIGAVGAAVGWSVVAKVAATSPTWPTTVYERVAYSSIQMVAITVSLLRSVVPLEVSISHDWGLTPPWLAAGIVATVALGLPSLWIAAPRWLAGAIAWPFAVLLPRILIPAGHEYLFEYQWPVALIGPVIGLAIVGRLLWVRPLRAEA